ncbi:MAG: hypothetical protein AAFR11_06820 [Pseudomonadota bacterium]
MADATETLILSVIGYGVFFGLMWVVLSRDAHWWRYLASAYASPREAALETRRFQHGVVYGKGGASKSYNGLLTIERRAEGVALSVIPPFSFFHKPLFIPYKDVQGWGQLWYVNAKSVELTFERAPDVKLVMPASQIEWLQQASGAAMEIRSETSPHTARPNLWYLAIFVQGMLALWLLGWLALR